VTVFMSLSASARVGPYEIVSLLGHGGMGEVYRARDPRLARDVAIKVLHSAIALDPDRRHRFEQEARAAGGLNHPNIVAVFDIGSDDGALYIVQELLEGETLRERLRAGPLPLRKSLDYAGQAARGLAAAHAKGIVHRDLKPENLFLTRDGRLKILDFGVAKLTARAGAKDATSARTETLGTEPGVVLGTIGYMSPEQVRGEVVDNRSDLFSLGAILFEMLTGRRAFQGPSPADTMSAILKEEAPELPASTPALLASIVRRCLEKIPEDRLESARDLAFALESFLTASGSQHAMPAAAAPRHIARRGNCGVDGRGADGHLGTGQAHGARGSLPISAGDVPSRVDFGSALRRRWEHHRLFGGVGRKGRRTLQHA
jgi:eukaryotic-like serine/threonine-protein kinase